MSELKTLKDLKNKVELDKNWIVHIHGKGINATVEVKNIKDLKIVKLLIKRIEKYLERGNDRI